MAFGQRSVLQSFEHVVGQLQQPDEVRDGDAAASNSSSDVLAGEAELLYERGTGTRLLDRVEVLTDHVLDEGELERRGVVVSADDPGYLGYPSELGGAPATLAGDELVAPLRTWPHEHGLQHAALLQRSCERCELLVVEMPARLARGWGDQ